MQTHFSSVILPAGNPSARWYSPLKLTDVHETVRWTRSQAQPTRLILDCGVYTYIRGDGPGAILFGDSAEEFQYMSHRLTDAERLLDFHILELMGVRKTVNWRPN